MWFDFWTLVAHINAFVVFWLLTIYNILLWVGVFEAIHFRSKKSNLWKDAKFAIKTMVDDFYYFREYRQERKEALWDLILLILGELSYKVTVMHCTYLDYKHVFIFCWKMLINEEFYFEANRKIQIVSNITSFIFHQTCKIWYDFIPIHGSIFILFLLIFFFIFRWLSMLYLKYYFEFYTFLNRYFFLNELTLGYNILYFFNTSVPLTFSLFKIWFNIVARVLFIEWRWTLLVWWGAIMRSALWTIYSWYNTQYICWISILLVIAFVQRGFIKFLHYFARIAVDLLLWYLFFYWYFLGVPIYFITGVTSDEVMWYMTRISRPSVFRYLFYWYLLFYEKLLFYVCLLYDYAVLWFITSKDNFTYSLIQTVEFFNVCTLELILESSKYGIFVIFIFFLKLSSCTLLYFLQNLMPLSFSMQYDLNAGFVFYFCFFTTTKYSWSFVVILPSSLLINIALTFVSILLYISSLIVLFFKKRKKGKKLK